MATSKPKKKSKLMSLLGGTTVSIRTHPKPLDSSRKTGSEPDIRRAKRPTPSPAASHPRWNIFKDEQPSKAHERRGRDPKCSCCRKYYNLLDSLSRVNPPKFCVYCGLEVCKRCHSNDSCHRCFTKERRDVKSISKLEEMDREELERIMRDLHCDKASFESKEKSQLILTILNGCKMDKSFIKQFEERTLAKKNSSDKKPKQDTNNTITQQPNDQSKSHQTKVDDDQTTEIKQSSSTEDQSNAEAPNETNRMANQQKQLIIINQPADNQINETKTLGQSYKETQKRLTRSLDRYSLDSVDDYTLSFDGNSSSSAYSSANFKEDRSSRRSESDENQLANLRAIVIKEIETATMEQLLSLLDNLRLPYNQP